MFNYAIKTHVNLFHHKSYDRSGLHGDVFSVYRIFYPKSEQLNMFRTPERAKPATPAKPSAIEDMFRVDRQSTPGSRHGTPARPAPAEDIFR